MSVRLGCDPTLAWRLDDAQVMPTKAGDASAPAELVYATRLLGRDPALAMHGAGNTSYKMTVRGPRGEARQALVVKASGTDMATVEAGDFVTLDRQRLLAVVEGATRSDEDFVAAAADCRLGAGTRRASIETPMHSMLPQPFVFHTHPNAVLALCNRRDGYEMVAAALGHSAAIVPYAPIGLALGRAVRDVWAAAPQADAFVLSYHGLVTWGPTARAAYQATIDLVQRADAYLRAHHVRTLASSVTVSTTERQRRYATLAPTLRATLAALAPAASASSPVLDVELDADIVAVLDAAPARPLFCSAPLTPDCLLRSRRVPLWLDQPRLDDIAAFAAQLADAIAHYQAQYRAYLARHTADAAFASSSFLPRSLLIPGLGVVTVGKDAGEASMIRDIALQGLRVKTAVWEGGGDYCSLGEDEMFEMEWRAFRQQAAASW